MAAPTAPRSFDEIIEKDRKKRKAEALAQKIFSRNRSTAAGAETRAPSPGGSLASRVGVNKSQRSVHQDFSKSRNSSALSRPAIVARLQAAVDENEVQGYRKNETEGTESLRRNRINRVPRRYNPGTELNIRGAAGPYTVVAQNFAPGTTAADIESVMQPVGGTMISCRLVASNPTVIAELMFMERSDVDTVIDTFNNKKADGRLLYVYLKQAVGASTASTPSEEIHEPVAPISTTVQSPARTHERERETDRIMEDARVPERNYRHDEPGRVINVPKGPQGNGRVERNTAAQPVDHGHYGFGGGRAPQQPWQDRRHDTWRGDGRDYFPRGQRPQNHQQWGPRNGW